MVSLFSFGLFSVVCAYVVPICAESVDSRIIAQLKSHQVIPEVVDEFSPQGLLTIEYTEGDPTSQVNWGNPLSLAATRNPPSVHFTPNNPDAFVAPQHDRFVLVMTDADAPSTADHSLSEFCHWVVTDVQLTSPRAGHSGAFSLDLSSANEVTPYVGPGPPENSGLHRYVFVLYKQDPQAKLAAPPSRARWGTQVAGSGVREWIAQSGHSDLLAVNFFLAESEVQV